MVLSKVSLSYYEFIFFLFIFLLEFSQCCFDILYLISLVDINELFLYKLFEWIIEKKFIFHADASLCANFIYKLTSCLQLSQSSSFLRFPYLNASAAIHETVEPIDYLLKSNKTQKLNIINSQNNENKQNFSQMINELPPKISCLNINLKSNLKQQDLSPLHNAKPQIRFSYSIVSMIRFDSDLIGFSTITGSNKEKTTVESYAHVFSKNLNNSTSFYEIWLNSNGNLLLM
jgi:hypothetical protein